MTSIGGIKFAVDVFKVGFDGLGGDAELVGDLLVAPVPFQKQQNLLIKYCLKYQYH